MDTMPRYVKLNNWIFEIKSVRALRVEHYGEPYSAIANFSLNGDVAYLDGLLTKADDDFTRKDYFTFKTFCQQLGMKHANFDRFKNDTLRSESFKITPTIPNNVIQLVR
jgi:hypothetical protein